MAVSRWNVVVLAETGLLGVLDPGRVPSSCGGGGRKERYFDDRHPHLLKILLLPKTRYCMYVESTYQSKTIRGPKYYKRVQFALTYCSYVHFI
jgi:hypothetical protein